MPNSIDSTIPAPMDGGLIPSEASTLTKRAYDTIVVGAGLFGCIIAKKLRAEGHKVWMVDLPRKGAGSTPAACLIKPSWVSSLGIDVVDPAMAILRELYDVQDIKFRVSTIGPLSTTVNWIDPKTILEEAQVDTVLDEVVAIREDGTVVLSNGHKLKADNLIIATGVWTNQIVPEAWHVPGLVGRAGVAFTWEGQIDEPFISVWAPYRQLVAFNRGPKEIWVGDGSAIDPKNWTPERQEVSMRRCMKALGTSEQPKGHLFGIRPYVKDAKPCYLTTPSKGVWIATGGAKNGTLAAAWCASEIAKALRS